jgi:hypothetical protein
MSHRQCTIHRHRLLMLHDGILGLQSGTTHAPHTNTAHRWQAVTDRSTVGRFQVNVSLNSLLPM